jgi:hypothetical protein
MLSSRRDPQHVLPIVQFASRLSTTHPSLGLMIDQRNWDVDHQWRKFFLVCVPQNKGVVVAKSHEIGIAPVTSRRPKV